jgi:hypothetical protein
MKVFVFSILLFFFTLNTNADTTKVLFIGNSYTYVNNLPVLFENISRAGGKDVLTDISAPGGYSLENHLSNNETINKIISGVWNYVVLQEQSQIPAIEYYRYNSMYPSARILDSLINQYNGNTVFYMTWGRRYGGQQCINAYCSPVFTNFYHMQDSLSSAYTQISNELNAIIAPVGNAWRLSVLTDSTVILWDADNSHPSLAGSYLAALVFYRKIFNELPSGISYTGGLAPAIAFYLQNIASTAPMITEKENIIFNNNIYLYDNYPNPFNQSSVFGFSCMVKSNISLKIYDILGREIAVLFRNDVQPGNYKFTFDAKNLSGGVYYYRLLSDSKSITKKFVLLK